MKGNFTTTQTKIHKKANTYDEMPKNSHSKVTKKTQNHHSTAKKSTNGSKKYTKENIDDEEKTTKKNPIMVS